MVALAGETATDCNVASLTVRVAGAIGEKVPIVAVMVTAVGSGTPVAAAANAFGATLFAATALLEDDHSVTRLVTSRVLPSLNVPIAENVTPVLLAMVGFAG